jgi:hypothetical protein
MFALSWCLDLFKLIRNTGTIADLMFELYRYFRGAQTISKYRLTIGKVVKPKVGLSWYLSMIIK